ncbi:MAG: hypothetical protein GXO42_00475 [bacterium]|nr:hypothetical protein [bacterium]
MKICHDINKCIRCGRCIVFFPELFTIKEGVVVLKNAEYSNGRACIEVQLDEQKARMLEKICPTGAIRIER